MTESAGLGSLLSAEAHFRERLDPQPSNPFFLILSGLRLALERALKKYDKGGSQNLDFGCGASSYRTIFQSESKYLRADLGGGPGQARHEPTEHICPFEIGIHDR